MWFYECVKTHKQQLKDVDDQLLIPKKKNILEAFLRWENMDKDMRCKVRDDNVLIVGRARY